jgi:hypothetical protein
MKLPENMPQRMRAHIHWLDGLTKPRRLLHWFGNSSCPECQWRREGRRTLQHVLSGKRDAEAAQCGAASLRRETLEHA